SSRPLNGPADTGLPGGLTAIPKPCSVGPAAESVRGLTAVAALAARIVARARIREARELAPLILDHDPAINQPAVPVVERRPELEVVAHVEPLRAQPGVLEEPVQTERTGLELLHADLHTATGHTSCAFDGREGDVLLGCRHRILQPRMVDVPVLPPVRRLPGLAEDDVTATGE